MGGYLDIGGWVVVWLGRLGVVAEWWSREPRLRGIDQATVGGENAGCGGRVRRWPGLRGLPRECLMSRTLMEGYVELYTLEYSHDISTRYLRRRCPAR